MKAVCCFCDQKIEGNENIYRININRWDRILEVDDTKSSNIFCHLSCLEKNLHENVKNYARLTRE